MLIANNASVLALQRQMGHHSAAYIYDTYGHLIDGRLGPVIDLDVKLADPAELDAPERGVWRIARGLSTSSSCCSERVRRVGAPLRPVGWRACWA